MAVVIVLIAAAEKLEDVIQIASLSIMLDDQYIPVSDPVEE